MKQHRRQHPQSQKQPRPTTMDISEDAEECPQGRSTALFVSRGLPSLRGNGDNTASSWLLMKPKTPSLRLDHSSMTDNDGDTDNDDEDSSKKYMPAKTMAQAHPSCCRPDRTAQHILTSIPVVNRRTAIKVTVKAEATTTMATRGSDDHSNIRIVVDRVLLFLQQRRDITYTFLHETPFRRIICCQTTNMPYLKFVIDIWQKPQPQLPTKTKTSTCYWVQVERRKGCAIVMQYIRRALFRSLQQQVGSDGDNNNNNLTHQTLRQPQQTNHARLVIGGPSSSSRMRMIPLDMCRRVYRKLQRHKNSSQQNNGENNKDSSSADDGITATTPKDDGNDDTTTAAAVERCLHWLTTPSYQLSSCNTMARDAHRLGMEGLLQHWSSQQTQNPQSSSSSSSSSSTSSAAVSAARAVVGSCDETCSADDDDDGNIDEQDGRWTMTPLQCTILHYLLQSSSSSSFSTMDGDYDIHNHQYYDSRGSGRGNDNNDMKLLALQLVTNALRVLEQRGRSNHNNKNATNISSPETGPDIDIWNDFWRPVLRSCRQNIRYAKMQPISAGLSMDLCLAVLRVAPADAQLVLNQRDFWVHLVAARAMAQEQQWDVLTRKSQDLMEYLQ